ncbi:MAG: hypothetical protein IJO83_00045 [Clostridia bacterium]|nr:hypothetical protein [Clostridia bacterium]
MAKRKGKETKLSKIVYFDEESVTDYLQIITGGTMEKTTELLNEDVDEGKAGADAKVSLGVGKMFKALMGMEASASVESSLSTSFNSREMAKNIIKNTILTDFISVLNEGENNTIKKFVGYEVSVHKDSLTYIALISPYLSMLKSGTAIPAGEFNIAVEKLDNTMKSAKGYYEFLGRKDGESVVFRFNIKSFKNNYKVTDLLKMNLSIYAIKVGNTTINQLNFNSELNIDALSSKKDNPSYQKTTVKSGDDSNNDQLLELYDVLLAGVESND